MQTEFSDDFLLAFSGFKTIEIINELTDKGQFQYLKGLKGLKRGLTCIQHNFFP